MEKDRKSESRRFLALIKQQRRKAQLFVDPYSIRDETTNRNIIDINKVLSKQSVKKKKINKKIDEYLNELELLQERRVDAKGILESIEKEKKEMYVERINTENDYIMEKHENDNKLFNDKNDKTNNSNKPTNTTKIKSSVEEYEKFKTFREKVIYKDSIMSQRENKKNNDKVKEEMMIEDVMNIISKEQEAVKPKTKSK